MKAPLEMNDLFQIEACWYLLRSDMSTTGDLTIKPDVNSGPRAQRRPARNRREFTRGSVRTIAAWLERIVSERPALPFAEGGQHVSRML